MTVGALRTTPAKLIKPLVFQSRQCIRVTRQDLINSGIFCDERGLIRLNRESPDQTEVVLWKRVALEKVRRSDILPRNAAAIGPLYEYCRPGLSK